MQEKPANGAHRRHMIDVEFFASGNHLPLDGRGVVFTQIAIVFQPLLQLDDQLLDARAMAEGLSRTSLKNRKCR